MTQANPIEITFHGVPHSDAADEEIRAQLEHLHKFFDRIHGCRVAVEREGHAGHYHLKVHLHVPGKELVVGRHPSQPGHEDLSVAIHDAFKAVGRQLQDYVRKLQGKTKHHFDAHQQARVSRLEPLEDYGFLEAFDGREIYFHRNSVVNVDFEDLEVGFEVRFEEEEGLKGPQASTVAVKAAAGT